MTRENAVLGEGVKCSAPGVKTTYHWLPSTRNIQKRQVRGDRKQMGQETAGGEEGSSRGCGVFFWGVNSF